MYVANIFSLSVGLSFKFSYVCLFWSANSSIPAMSGSDVLFLRLCFCHLLCPVIFSIANMPTCTGSKQLLHKGF